MLKSEIYEVLAKRQDCNAKTLQNPSEHDYLSKYFKKTVDDAESVEDIKNDLNYAISMLQNSLSELSSYEDKTIIK